MTEAPNPTAALILVADNGLRDEVRRASAAAGRECVSATAPVGRLAWKRASMVIVDDVSAASTVSAGLPRRTAVTLVTTGEPQLSDWQQAAVLGAEYVLALPDQSAHLVEIFGDYPSASAAGGLILATMGGRGGAGASTLAAALALRAAETKIRPHTLLADGDPTGGGLDLVLGIEDRPGLRWSGLVVENGRVSAAALHNALPGTAANLSVLSSDRPLSGPFAGHLATTDNPGPTAAAVESVLHAARDAGDLVVCDVGLERAAAAEVMLEAADLVALVVPADLRSAAAAGFVSAYVAARNLNQGLVVRGPAPGGLRASQIADNLGLPVLATMRPQPQLARRVERAGLRLGRGPLRRAADAVLAVLANHSTVENRRCTA